METINNTTSNAIPEIMDRKLAARYLNIGLSLLDKSGIPTVNIGRRVLYSKSDIDTWFQQRKQKMEKAG